VNPKVVIVTPPFTQLNTPYPASAYLKGFLNTKGITSVQWDLGIEVILELFSSKGLSALFEDVYRTGYTMESENAVRIIQLRSEYIQTIDHVILFLQGKLPELAHRIVQGHFLPEASRFNQLDDLDWAFGRMGIQDKAKHLATLYLEDLSDFIQLCVDSHFGFSRYAEHLGRSAHSFDDIYDLLNSPPSYIDQILLKLLAGKLNLISPKLVAISVPFPGNLLSAFRIAQWIKNHRPEIKLAMGGGFPNTELRSVSDVRVFEFFDFISLDDGEAPIEHIIEYLDGKRPIELLKRTFVLQDKKVSYSNLSLNKDYSQADTGTPDYSDLLMDQYISVIEMANPMHSLWSDGTWNKLTMAHGCYWGKCTFCDISLDYIKVYEPITASLLCDRMEALIRQNGIRGFHFVDEAAPPALMRALALEIIRRKLVVSWWTNIRFEKNFTKDLCLLLSASGCIAVSGGLEVASDRLLDLIKKGVTVSQVAQVTRNFSEANIMVHAYLMYGFPTQTKQEIMDSLEMVRQLFELNVLQSAFWHQFAMTAHSPVGLRPQDFGIQKYNTDIGAFANNDMEYIDPLGIDYSQFSFGLKKSLLNYMHGIGFEFPLQDWFDMKVPKTKVDRDFILNAIQESPFVEIKSSAKIIFLGGAPLLKSVHKIKKGQSMEYIELTFHTKVSTIVLLLESNEARWLLQILNKLSIGPSEVLTFEDVKNDYMSYGLGAFDVLWFGKAMDQLREAGLLLVV